MTVAIAVRLDTWGSKLVVETTPGHAVTMTQVGPRGRRLFTVALCPEDARRAATLLRQAAQASEVKPMAVDLE